MCSSPGLYEFVIPEDLPIGKMGGKVKANDRDVGDNSKSTYSIVEGDDQGVFEIITDAQTQEGILRLKKVRVETRWNWSTLHALSVSVSHRLTVSHGQHSCCSLFAQTITDIGRTSWASPVASSVL